MRMNREMNRAAKKIGKKMMKLPESNFEELPYSEVSRVGDGKMVRPDRIWKSNHYSVQFYKKERSYFGVLMDKLMIRRHDAEPIREWHVLQKIKSEILGDEAMAIQVFPAESELVDVANMYWLFTPSDKRIF